MKYNVKSIWSSRYPKIIGSYEYELIPILKNLVEKNYETIINIGCAEGYYAVGFATHNHKSNIIAVDPLAISRDYLYELSKDNNVIHQIKFYRYVTTDRLNNWIKGKTLIIMDCEGAELGLLKPNKCKNLFKSDILVEVHEFVEKNLGKILMTRLSKTHIIEYIKQRDRLSENFDILNKIDNKISQILMDEKRPANLHWLYCEAKNN